MKRKLFAPLALMLAFVFGMSVNLNSQAVAAAPQKVVMETTGAKIVTVENHVLEFRLAYDTTETSGIPFVLVHCYIDGVYVGTPDRFKAAGNRIAEDEPRVDPNKFITDGDETITNG